MATFVADLRNLSDDCNFRESLEDMLRGRLVCGINNYQIQRRLWAETKLKYQKAVELAFAIERARKIWVICQKQMQIQGSEQSKSTRPRIGSRYQCGRKTNTATVMHESKNVRLGNLRLQSVIKVTAKTYRSRKIDEDRTPTGKHDRRFWKTSNYFLHAFDAEEEVCSLYNVPRYWGQKCGITIDIDLCGKPQTVDFQNILIQRNIQSCVENWDR